MRIHLDTDLGGDTDDACALAMPRFEPAPSGQAVRALVDVDATRSARPG